jgi:hypothetical protein
VTGFSALIFASIALRVRIRGDMGSRGPRPNGLGSYATSSLRRPGISRVMPIAVTTWPDEAKRTSNSACVWIAEATVEDRIFIARSRHGPVNELARQLGAAGLPDRPMVIRYSGLAGTLTYRSFYAAAMWTFSEGDRTLRRVRYREPPEGVFLGGGTGRKCVSSPAADDVESRPANGRKAPPPAVGTRHCDGCGAVFRPARPWSRFCCPACRLRPHRRLAGDTKAQTFAAIFESDTP